MQRTNTTILFPDAGNCIYVEFKKCSIKRQEFYSYITIVQKVIQKLLKFLGDTNIPSIRKGSVTITGAIHNVYFARQQLLVSYLLCTWNMILIYRQIFWEKFVLAQQKLNETTF